MLFIFCVRFQFSETETGMFQSSQKVNVEKGVCLQKFSFSYMIKINSKDLWDRRININLEFFFKNRGVTDFFGQG